jgi:exopolysaccharide production protein ExoQ
LFSASLSENAVYGLSNATGRTSIWEVAIIAVGLENPLFGQGGDFWNQVLLRPGFSGATSAHNLFLEIFSRSGFIGLTALSIFLFFLVRYSLRAYKNTNGGSIALLIAFFVRAMFKSTIDTDAVLSGSFLGGVAYFIYVIDRGAKPIRNINKLELSVQVNLNLVVHNKLSNVSTGGVKEKECIDVKNRQLL